MTSHQTTAANRLDPNVSADGHFNAGPGVGAQAPERIAQEGGEHLSSSGGVTGGSTTGSSSLGGSNTGPSTLGSSTLGSSSTGGSSTLGSSTLGSSTGGSSTLGGSSTTGASHDRVHDNGIDHIKSRLDDRGALGNTSSTTSSGLPAGSSGYGDSLSSITGPSETEAQSGGIVGTIKSYLGFTGAEADAARRAEETGPSAVHDSTTAGLGSTTGTHGTASSHLPGTHDSSTLGRDTTTGTHHGTTSSHNTSSTGNTTGSTAAGVGAAAASALGYDGTSSHNTSSLPDRTRDTTTTTGSTATDHARDTATTGGSLSDRTRENTTGSAANSSFDNTGSSSSGRVQDPSVDSSAAGTTPVPTEGTGAGRTDTEHKSGAEKDLKSGANPKTLENPSAIPTAGGEKLGQKHWGESKIVPDLPPTAETRAGVASADATSEVKDNTAKNTGGATSGPHGTTGTHAHGTADDTTGKESLADKIKDKLHIGSKE